MARPSTSKNVRMHRELEDAGARGFPFVRIGNEVIEGYQPARFAELLHIEGEPA